MPHQSWPGETIETLKATSLPVKTFETLKADLIVLLEKQLIDLNKKS